MVESITAKILNRVLADYVESFDKQALKIGIWNGTLELKNLDLKIGAFVHDELDLPVNIKVCRIEKITIKIPWRSICSQPVDVSVDGLYVLAEPDIPPTLNSEKEEKDNKMKKQKKMSRNEKENKAIAEKEKKNFSFFEKLIMWILMSMQIRICNIHIRYEDNVSSPMNVFSIGLSLVELSLGKMKKNKVQREENKPEILISKLVKMHSLAVYWDTHSRQYGHRPYSRAVENLKKEFATESAALPHQWLIKPFSSDGYIGLNFNPKMNKFKFPKILLENGLDTIDMEISKLQYNSMMEILLAFEKRYQMRENIKHQKEDPRKHAEHRIQEKVKQVGSRSHYMNMVNRTPIKRVEKSTDGFKRHVKSSNKIGSVREELTKKQTGGGFDPFDDYLLTFEDMLELDTEISTDRSGRQVKSSYGLEMETEDKTLKERLEEVLNEEEKKKLFATIGYKENEVDDAFPEDFAAVKILFRMKKINLTLTDESKTAQVLKLKLTDVYACVEQKPAKNVIQFNGNVHHLTMEGPQQDGIASIVIESKNIDGDDTFPFLDVFLEKNPVDMFCDTRVIVKARPLQIVFKDIFIKNTIAFLKPPAEVTSMERLLKAATVWLKNNKDSTVENAMKQSKRKDVNIELMPWCITFPFGDENQTEIMNKLFFDRSNQKMHSKVEEKTSHLNLIRSERIKVAEGEISHEQQAITCYTCKVLPATFRCFLCEHCNEKRKMNFGLHHDMREWFCSRCDKPGCTCCMVRFHYSHPVIRLPIAFQELTAKLKGQKELIENDLLPKYDLAVTNEIAKQIEIFDRVSEIERNISEYTHKLHGILQKEKEAAIRHLRKEESKGLQRIESYSLKLERTITELKEMNEKLSMNLAAQPQFSLFYSINSMELKTFETLPSSPDYAFSDFQPQILPKELEEKFGKLPYLLINGLPE